jgi:hypothetical protein
MLAGDMLARGRPSGVQAGALLSASVLLLGVTVAVGLGVASGFARRCGGASGGTAALQVVELRRWRIWLRAGPCAGGGRGAVGRRSLPVDGGHDGGALAASVSLLGAQGENLVLRDVRRRRLGVVTFLKASCSGAPSLVVWSLPVVLLVARWSALLSGC